MVNYRGFGLSEGTPTEKAVLADAKLVYDWAAANPEAACNHCARIRFDAYVSALVTISATSLERPGVACMRSSALRALR